MTRVDSARVKKYAKMAYTRFDMCVSTLFSPFAGVLYTVSALEKEPKRSRSRADSRASSSQRSSSRSSREQSESRASSRASSHGSEVRPSSRASTNSEVFYSTYV